ncbi:hypothetical protein E2C01_060399 [Portunus trituberculatus]|uniref:Uncharacterized protein n=1 Tax=Portunus trituberculatus TaxID=210409 RepID=A0A5B7H552_PORTR|nr:hypothetical protein [Portunus trituberculatus]
MVVVGSGGREPRGEGGGDQHIRTASLGNERHKHGVCSRPDSGKRMGECAPLRNTRVIQRAGELFDTTRQEGNERYYSSHGKECSPQQKSL